MAGSRYGAMPPTLPDAALRAEAERAGRRAGSGSRRRREDCEAGSAARAGDAFSSACCAGSPTSGRRSCRDRRPPRSLLELERLARRHAETLPPLELMRLTRTCRPSPRPGSTRSWSWRSGREVPLPGGGRLLIEPTAACVAIDVDGGGRAPTRRRPRRGGRDRPAGPPAQSRRHDRRRLRRSAQPAGAAAAGGGAAQGVPGSIRRRWRSTRCRRSGIVTISRARRGAPLAEPVPGRHAQLLRR